MDDALTLFEHVYIDNHSIRTLFLLHGTGGSKEDFLFLDELLKKRYNLLGLKGNIDEHGMARFFKRNELGIFDQESITAESEKLIQFIRAWKTNGEKSNQQLFFLGYSNGANILLAALFKYPRDLNNLILLHAMQPFQIESKSVDLKNHRIFLSIGEFDRMIQLKDSLQLVDVLKSLNTDLQLKKYPSGHEITPIEIKDIIEYLDYTP